MATCIRGGVRYKRHDYNEQGVCQHCKSKCPKCAKEEAASATNTKEA